MNAELKESIHNRFDIEVIDSRTGKVKQKAKAENVVCNGYYTSFGSSSSRYTILNYIDIGSGTGTPSSNDTSLFHKEGHYQLGDPVWNSNQSEKWISVMRHIQINETTLAGATITELGLISEAGPLGTHAMLQDMNGNPISIEKTNVDVINIYATLFLHRDDFDDGHIVWLSYSDSLFTRILLHQEHDLTGLKAAILNETGTLYSLSQTTIDIALEFKNNGRTVKATPPRIGVNDYNQWHGIPGFYIYRGAAEFLPGCSAYPYNPITNETIGTGDGVKTGFMTWFDVDNTKPITVKVNGETVTGWTYRKVPIVNLAYKYLRPIHESSTLDSIIYITENVDRLGMHYCENPYYQSCGITTWSMAGMQGRKFSDDLISWTNVPTADVPNNLRYKRFMSWETVSQYVSAWSDTKIETAPNIIFSVPPEVGAVVTIDYTPSVIAKDSNHVFDFTASYQLGEYTPE